MSARPDFQERLDRLRRSYAEALPGLVREIEAAKSDPEAAYRTAHQLAGTSGTYGFEEISSLARKLETRLRDGAESADEVDRLIAALREAAGRA